MKTKQLIGGFAAAAAALVVAAARAADPVFPMISDGLILNMDASDLTTLTINDAGDVTSWRSKVGSMEFASAADIGASYDLPPCYHSAGFGSRGAVRCGATVAGTTSNTYLLAKTAQSTPVRTHMLMINYPVKCGANIGYTYGYLTYGVGGSKSVTGVGVFGGEWGGDYVNAGLWGCRFSKVEDSDIFDNGEAILMRQGPTLVSASRVLDWIPNNTSRILSVLVSEDLASVAERTSGRQTIGTYMYGFAVRNLPMDYAQVLNWSRELTEPERLYMESWLEAKWTDTATVCEWTGEGDGETWGDSANWQDGVLPTAASIAVISAPAKAIKVAAEAQVSVLILRNAASVKVESNVRFAVDKLLSVYGTTAVQVASGGNFTYGFVHKWSGSSISFALDAATLAIATPSHGRCYNSSRHNNKTIGMHLVRSWPLTAQPHESIAGDVTGTGELVFCGSGMQKLEPSLTLSDGLAVKVVSGVLDLKGKSISVSTLEGQGQVTNSAAAATLTVETATTGSAMPFVYGGCGIDLVLKGGSIALGGCQPQFDGTISVTAGTTVVKEELDPVMTMGGVTWRIDASRPETMVTSSIGRLTCMYSCTPERGRFYALSTLQMPKYAANAFNGKPALGFGMTDAGAFKQGDSYSTAMQQDIVCSNLTLVVVHCPNSVMGANMLKYLIGRGNVPSDDYRRAVGDNTWYGLGFTDPNQSNYPSNYTAHAGVAQQIEYRNGVCLYDYDAGKTDPVPIIRTAPQVFIASVSTGADCSKLTYNPCIGTTYGLTGRFYIGYIAEAMAFDRALTHAEMQTLSAYLMRKWGIEPESGVALEPAAVQLSQTTLALTGGAVDFGGLTARVAKVSAVKSAAVDNGTVATAALEMPVKSDLSFAKLSGSADWDVDGMTVTFNGGLPQGGTLIQTSGTIYGTLGTVTPAKLAAKLKQTDNVLKLSAGGLMILFR